jgi:hypothetical protein
MQPQQPYSNPYDFITNPQKPSRPPLMSFSGGSGGGMGMRIAVVGIGLVLLIVILIAISSLFKGGSNVANMKLVAQDQAELVRVTTLATQDQSNDISQNTTLYFAMNTNLTVSSAQQKLLAFLSSHGAKISKATLALKTNSQTTQALSAAAASSTYDTTFLNAMQGDMSTYVADLKVAYAASKNPQEQQLLKTDYQSAQLLTQELTSAQNNVNSGT